MLTSAADIFLLSKRARFSSDLQTSSDAVIASAESETCFGFFCRGLIKWTVWLRQKRERT